MIFMSTMNLLKLNANSTQLQVTTEIAKLTVKLRLRKDLSLLKCSFKRVK